MLFIGTSMVQQDVSVEIIEDELESVKQAHNAALPGAQTQVVQRWLLEEMLPRLNSPRVVWGVSSIDFNGNRPGKVIDSYNAFRATRPGALGAIDRFLGDLSALSHYRDQLRNPARVGAMIGLREAPKHRLKARVHVDLLLAPRNRTEGKSENLEGLERRARRRSLADWAIGPAEAEAFRSTLITLLESDVEVVVVLMPVPDGYVRMHPNGEQDFAEFVAYATGVADELGIPLFDHSRDFSDTYFHDLTHLNRIPAERFSRRLAEDLAGLGW